MKTLTDIASLLIKSVKLIAHPVGSVYISTQDTSPEDLFGGTWEQIQDTFLWCAGSNHPAGTTGGEENHQLTVAEMPSHAHTVRWWNNAGTAARAIGFADGSGDPYYIEDGIQVATGSGTWQSNPYAAQEGYGDQCGNTNFIGATNAHNNMPPYLSVYAWKRTA